MPIVTTSDEMRGKVVFMRDDEMTCFWSLNQIMEEMLASGAIAVLFGSRRDSTYSILVSKGRGRAMPKGAFDIPMFTIASSLSDGFTKALVPKNGVPEEVMIKLPPMKFSEAANANIGPNFDVNLKETPLPTTKVQVMKKSSLTKGFEEVGYATFNPTDYGQVTAELVKLEVPRSCANLGQCHQCESEENFVLNSKDLNQKVALIREEDFLCVHPVSVLTCTLQHHNVRGVLYASTGNELRTLESSGYRCDGKTAMKIPSFFVIKAVADRLVLDLQTQKIEVKLPGIRNGVPDRLAANPTDRSVDGNTLGSSNFGDSDRGDKDDDDFPVWLAILCAVLAVALIALIVVGVIYRKRRKEETDRAPMLAAETNEGGSQTEIALVPTSSGDEEFGAKSDRDVAATSASC